MIPTSIVAYDGRSAFTGDRIQLIITGIVRPSQNPKTGPMAQSSIIVANKHPLDVLGTPLERAICNSCKHMSSRERTCYVYSRMLLHLARKFPVVSRPEAKRLMGWIRGLRIGEYGDPAALPFSVWDSLLDEVGFFTGYTHAWDTCDPRFKGIVMASVDSPEEHARAKKAGWRTYRIRATEPEKPLPGEVVCPFEAENILCYECRLCCGTARKGPDVVITAHGRGAKRIAARSAVCPGSSATSSLSHEAKGTARSADILCSARTPSALAAGSAFTRRRSSAARNMRR